MYAGAERSDASASAPLAAQDTGGAVGSSGTGTNVQEADVDESDIAKTDGSTCGADLGARAGGHRRVRRPALASCRARRCPVRRWRRPELLLRDDQVVVVGDEVTDNVFYGGDDRTLPARAVDRRPARIVISFDLGDPSAPEVTDHQVVDGGAMLDAGSTPTAPSASW